MSDPSSLAPWWILKVMTLNPDRFMCDTICPPWCSCQFELQIRMLLLIIPEVQIAGHEMSCRPQSELEVDQDYVVRFSSHLHEASNKNLTLGRKDKEKEREERKNYVKGAGMKEAGWETVREREWKPSENPYTWFIPVRLCAVGRSYLLFMRASAAKRPDVKLCGDLI